MLRIRMERKQKATMRHRPAETATRTYSDYVDCREQWSHARDIALSTLGGRRFTASRGRN